MARCLALRTRSASTASRLSVIGNLLVGLVRRCDEDGSVGLQLRCSAAAASADPGEGGPGVRRRRPPVSPDPLSPPTGGAAGLDGPSSRDGPPAPTGPAA